MGSSSLGFTEGELQRESYQGEWGDYRVGVVGQKLKRNLRVRSCLSWAGWVGQWVEKPSQSLQILALLYIFDFHTKSYKDWTETDQVAFWVVLHGVVGWAGGCKNQPSPFKLRIQVLFPFFCFYANFSQNLTKIVNVSIWVVLARVVGLASGWKNHPYYHKLRI